MECEQAIGEDGETVINDQSSLARKIQWEPSSAVCSKGLLSVSAMLGSRVEEVAEVAECLWDLQWEGGAERWTVMQDAV